MLSTTQTRVERSLFEAIRKVCVAEGYTPDIANTGVYGVEPYTAAQQTLWNNALTTIAGTKGFAIDVRGHNLTKGMKKTPRIEVISRRTLPGDIGSGPERFVFDEVSSLQLPAQASHFYYDIHLISSSAAQDRILNAILSKALGLKKYILWYDDEPELFFIHQTSYYDLPDPIEGQEEKVYTYEVPDLYEVIEDIIPVVPINEIRMELISMAPGAILNDDLTITGQYIEDGGVIVTAAGKEYN